MKKMSKNNKVYIKPCVQIKQCNNTCCFFEKKIYIHKTNQQKNHTYNTKHTVYKRKEIKAKKRLEILKEGRKKKVG